MDVLSLSSALRIDAFAPIEPLVAPSTTAASLLVVNEGQGSVPSTVILSLVEGRRLRGLTQLLAL